MEKGFMIFCLVLFCAATGQGQSLPSLRTGPPMPVQYGLVSFASKEPLVLLGTLETDFSSLLVDPKEISVVKTYRDSAVLATMGHKARHGVLLIELKNKKTLLPLEDLLDYFEVPQAQRQLRVLVNRQPVNRTHLLADVKRIEKLEVITQDKISLFRLSWDENEQFLNIVTVKDAP